MELSKKEIQARRVELLEFMRALPPEKVQMSVFQGRWPEGVEHIPRELRVGCFSGTDVLQDCGTVACIFGWANYLFRDRDPEYGYHPEYEYLALGLNYEEGNELSLPESYASNHEFYTRDKVIETLERWVATGVVDWQRPENFDGA